MADPPSALLWCFKSVPFLTLDAQVLLAGVLGRVMLWSQLFKLKVAVTFLGQTGRFLWTDPVADPRAFDPRG